MNITGIRAMQPQLPQPTQFPACRGMSTAFVCTWCKTDKAGAAASPVKPLTSFRVTVIAGGKKIRYRTDKSGWYDAFLAAIGEYGPFAVMSIRSVRKSKEAKRWHA